MPGPGEPVDLEDDDGEPSPEVSDPDRGFRRLILSILVLSLLDFTAAKDPQAWTEARAFLFPTDPIREEHLRIMVQVCGIDLRWFTDRCEKLKLTARCPAGPATGKTRCLRKWSMVQEGAQNAARSV